MNHRPSSRNPLRAPVTVTWEITFKCNLQCSHCLSAHLEKTPAELDLRQCRSFIDELSRLEVFQINFGGGEPFLREDFIDVLECAHSKGIVTCVSTNGLVHDGALVARLAQMDLLRIQISLDGATAGTNDTIRGQGTYHRILEGIDLFKKGGLSSLSINMVVTRTNYAEIEEVIRISKFYGIRARLSRFRPSGNAKIVWQQYCLTEEQLIGLARFLDRHREVMTGDSFFSITGESRRDLGLNICGAARMTCSVLADGSVYPCAFLRDEPFKAGNIIEKRLGEIWDRAPIFHELRSLRVEACENCSRFSLCQGGCPAVANYLFKSLGPPDPECLASLSKKDVIYARTI